MYDWDDLLGYILLIGIYYLMGLYTTTIWDIYIYMYIQPPWVQEAY